MPDSDLVAEAARRLLDAAPPTARVILFGSRARGRAHEHSDLDFLVIEREVENRWAERTRLREAVADVPAAFDLFVASEAEMDRWGGVRGTMLHEALANGKVMNGG